MEVGASNLSQHIYTWATMMSCDQKSFVLFCTNPIICFSSPSIASDYWLTGFKREARWDPICPTSRFLVIACLTVRVTKTLWLLLRELSSYLLEFFRFVLHWRTSHSIRYQHIMCRPALNVIHVPSYWLTFKIRCCLVPHRQHFMIVLSVEKGCILETSFAP